MTTKIEYMLAPLPPQTSEEVFVNALNLKGNEGWMIRTILKNGKGLYARPVQAKKPRTAEYPQQVRSWCQKCNADRVQTYSGSGVSYICDTCGTLNTEGRK